MIHRLLRSRFRKTLTPRRAHGIVSGAIFAAGLGMHGAPAAAYVFETTFGMPLHWLDQDMTTPGTIDIFYDFRNIGSYTNVITLEQRAIYQQALADWSAVTSGKLVFTLDTTRNIDEILNLSVGDLKAVNPGANSASGGTLGIANINYDGDGAINFAAVQLDHLENWDLLQGNGNLASPIPPDFYSVALHEVGHTLGLDHADSPFSNIMTTNFRGEKLGPSADDILGMATLYKATPDYTAISRTIASFEIGFPPGYFNYYSGNPSTLSYWTDSGITTVSGTTQVMGSGEFRQGGGVWNTQFLIVGAPAGSGFAEITAGTFTANTVLVSKGTLSLAGGVLQARQIDIGGGTTFNWTGGTLSLTPGVTPPTLTGISQLAVPTSGVLQSAANLTLEGMAVDGRAKLLPNGTASTTNRINSLSIGGTANAWTGQLDLGANIVVMQETADKAGAISRVQNQIASGHAAGTWTGNGITSSTLPEAAGMGLALLNNADLHLTSFRGIGGLNDDSLILALVHVGDANADNRVDAFDLNLLAANWQSGVAAWSGGDFNYDAKVDAFDLNILAANWQYGVGGSLLAAMQAYPELTLAAVPEPASVALLAGGISVLLGRRRHLPKGRAA